MQNKDAAAAEYDIVGGLLRTYSSSKSSGSDYALGSGETGPVHARRETEYNVPTAADVDTSALYDVADEADPTYDAANAVDAPTYGMAAAGNGRLKPTPYEHAGGNTDTDVLYDIGDSETKAQPSAPVVQDELYDHGDGLDVPAAGASKTGKTYVFATAQSLGNT